MATIEDNYIIAGADTDYLNCDSTDGWGKGGNAADPVTQDERVEGNKSLGLQTSDTGESWWYHDISPGNRFKITEYDLGLWFMYIKGKGNAYLVNDSSAVVVRLYFGDTDTWADYHLTKKGNASLKYGWQMLMCSGKELNGGSTSDGFQDSDFDKEIVRFEFRLNAANKIDHNLGLDCIFIGNNITIKDGDKDNPYLLSDLEYYANNSRPNFPIGVVKSFGTLLDINTGLTIDNAYVKDTNKYILINQKSSEVKHHLSITNTAKFEIGDKTDGVTTGGCYLTKPAGRNADITVSNDSIFNVYNSKLSRWNIITLDGQCDIQDSAFIANEVVKINNSDIQMENNEIYDSTSNTLDEAIIVDNVGSINKLKVYSNKVGIRFNKDLTVNMLECSNNSDVDIEVADSVNIEFINSSYNSIKGV